MSFFSKVWGVVKKVAPVAIGYALTGTPIGAAIGGGLGSAARGGDLSQILQGASYGYGAGTGLSALSAAGAVPTAGTVGPQSTGIIGGIKNLATGAPGALTAAGNAISPTLTSAISDSGSTLANAGTAISNFAAHPIEGVTSLASKGVNSLSNILTGGGKAAAPISIPGVGKAATVAGAGAGGGSSAFGGAGTLLNALSGISNLRTEDKAKDELLNEQRKSLSLNEPFLKTGTAANNLLADKLGTSGNTGAEGYGQLTSRFNPGDLTQDPGYKFQLEQGTQAMNRANAAAGNLDSGEALKEAQQFGTGLADNTYNAAFQRWLQNNAQNYDVLSGQQGVGMNAAGNAQEINTGVGNVKANATVAKNNTMTGALSSLLSGAGARRVIGYKPDGTAIYA